MHWPVLYISVIIIFSLHKVHKMNTSCPTALVPFPQLLSRLWWNFVLEIYVTKCQAYLKPVHCVKPKFKFIAFLNYCQAQCLLHDIEYSSAWPAAFILNVFWCADYKIQEKKIFVSVKCDFLCNNRFTCWNLPIYTIWIHGNLLPSSRKLLAS